MTNLTWPVGRVEQLLYLENLQKQFASVNAPRIGITIQGYTEPPRSAWELAYIQQASASLPIPPGTRLCWYNMKTGRVELFTTAYDQENGKSSSGTVYPYTANQNPEPFRLLGQFSVSGIRNAEDHSSYNVHFGFNAQKWVTRGLRVIDIYFRVGGGFSIANEVFWFSWGNLMIEAEAIGVFAAHNIQGFVTGATSASLTQATSSQLKRGIELAPTGASGQSTPGFIRIFNPFPARDPDTNLRSGLGQTSAVGTLWSGDGSTTGGYLQFASTKFYPNNLEQGFRMFKGDGTNGPTLVDSENGRGWAYGYFDTPIGKLGEYDDD